jgi:hypothetical protein
MSSHTFLLAEGVWQAEGEYRDARGRAQKARGESRVVHQENAWANQGFMLLDDGTRIRTSYRIEPFGPETVTEWVSENPDLGAMQGTFTLVGPSILCLCSSPNGAYRGVECLHRKDAGTYRARGTLFRDETPLSTWDLTLKRVQERP